MLALRPVDGWIRSVRGHISGKPLTFCERIFYHRLTGLAFDAIDQFPDGALQAAHSRYCGQVLNDFAGEEERLLVVDLVDPAMGTLIAAHGGFEAPQPFLQVR